MVLLALLLVVSARARPKLTIDDALKVKDGTLIQNGQAVVLRGVTVPGLDSSSLGSRVFRSCRVAIEDWRANTIKLPVSQDRWFGKAPDQHGKADEYRAAVDDVATYVTRSNAYLILDLSWSNAGQWGKNLGRHRMPDLNSEAFWKDAAHHFKSNSRILFGLFDAPHDVDWPTWKDGGLVAEPDITYQAVGMQKLIADVRSQRAKNVLVIDGIAWGNDLSQAAAIADPLTTDLSGAGIAYEVQIPWAKLQGDSGGWVEVPDACRPIIFGGVGDSPGPISSIAPDEIGRLLKWIAALGAGITAPAMSPDSFPPLVSDMRYTPTPVWGESIKKLLSSASSGSR